MKYFRWNYTCTGKGRAGRDSLLTVASRRFEVTEAGND
jgi:hypothetical protein